MSVVFVIETITGSQIKAIFMGVLNLNSDLRKTYPAECQTMVSSTFRSHFCRFEVMQGTADLGGRVVIFGGFFAKIV